MEMENVLSAGAAIGAEEVHSLGFHGFLQAGRNSLGEHDAVRGQIVRQVVQRWVVFFGYDECVAPAHRLNVQKRNGAVVFVNDADHFFTANYPAEHAALVNHGFSSAQLEPASWRLILQDTRRASQIPQQMSTADTRIASGSVAAILPLFLLEAVHAHDRPDEILEDEDLTVSLPRRLGLTGVIDTQKRRYESAVKSGKKVPLEEFASLVRLVLKRPDAEAILRDTGHRMANDYFRRVPDSYIKLLRALPHRLLVSRWVRAARRLLRQMGGEHVEGSVRPLAVRLRPAPLALLEPAGACCVMYCAALEQLAELYATNRPTVEHSRCASQDGETCEWKLDSLDAKPPSN